mgnify:CR=1 FL=1
MAEPKYEKDGHTHTADCPCDFCEATRNAWEAAVKKFQALAAEEQKKDDKKKK